MHHRPCSGELYPVETDARLCDVLTTGQEVEVDMEADVLTDLATGKKYSLKPLGDAGPVIDAGARGRWRGRLGRGCWVWPGTRGACMRARAVQCKAASPLAARRLAAPTVPTARFLSCLQAASLTMRGRRA